VSPDAHSKRRKEEGGFSELENGRFARGLQDSENLEKNPRTHTLGKSAETKKELDRGGAVLITPGKKNRGPRVQKGTNLLDWGGIGDSRVRNREREESELDIMSHERGAGDGFF